MSFGNVDFLKWGIAGCFGGAVVGVLLAGYRVARMGRGEGAGMVSMRRGEMREMALGRSPVFRGVLPWLSVVAAMTARLDLEGLRNYVRGPYAQAGYPGGLEDDEVVSLGVLMSLGLMGFVGFSAVVLLGVGYFWVGLLGVPLGFLVLVTSLKSQAAVRENQILQGLPYVLDLMVLMLRSGTSLRIALSRVVEDYRYHAIGVEFGQVLAEMDVGTSRSEAFRRLAERLKVADVTSLTDAIVQSEELGWPLAETLERLADRLSSERVLRAQDKAGAAGVLVMLPSTMVLAAAVLLLFGPIIVRALRGGSLM